MKVPTLGLFGRRVLLEVFVHVGVAVLAALTLFLAVDLVETGNAVQDGGLAVVSLELWNIPLVLQQILGIAVPIGVSTAAAGLLRRGELLAMLAAGASPAILIQPVLVAGALVGALHGLNTEFVAPVARAEVAALRRSLGLSSQRASVGRAWFRGERHFYRIEALEDAQGRVLGGVLVLRIQNGHLLERWEVERLRFEEGWIGEGIVARRFTAAGPVTWTTNGTVALALAERPHDFVQSVGAPDRLPLAALWSAVAARARLGQPTVEHWLELYRRGAVPLGLLGVAALAAAFALELGKRATLAAALGLGAGVGFGAWIVDETAQAAARALAVGPAMAVGGTLLVISAIAVWGARRAQKRGLQA